MLVAALTNEPGTAAMQGWLERQSNQTLAISDWTATEFSSALAIKMRTGHLGQEARAAALALFQQVVSDSLEVLPIGREHFRIAARFADHHDLGLRAGDALHLAVAADHGAAVCTLDRLMAEAGLTLGIPTIVPA